MKRRLTIWSAAVFALAQSAAADSSDLDGRQLYLQLCAGCHGQEATGGAALEAVAPPDLTAIAERRDLVWPILEVMSIIDGYSKSTEPREGMPVIAEVNEGTSINFDTGNGIAVIVPSNLLALVTYLESIQSPRPTRYVP